MAAALFMAAGLLLPTPARAEHIDFTEYDLPNGLHVILHPEHSVPVVASYVLYHVGSKDERPDRTGFAHFFEHLMFEGTENIGRGQLFKLVSAAGGNLNASTSADRTDYYINLPANQLSMALWIESERMMHAKIEEIGVETQRKVVKEERRMRYDNQPYGSLFEEMAKLVFAGTPYSWVPIGSVQYIDEAKIEEFRDFYHKYYLPNDATLVLAGDFDPENTRRQIEEFFGPIPHGPDPERPEFHAALPIALPELHLPPSMAGKRPRIDSTPRTAPQTVEVIKQNTPLPASLHAWRAPRQTEPDAYAVQMLTSILAEGRSSRLYRRLVDKEQAAVQAQAFPYLLEKAGMVGVFAVGNRGVTLEKLDELIHEELAAVQKDGVTDEEYQKARNQKEAEFASSFGTMSARARALADYHVFYGNADLINTDLANYLKVTKEDLKRVANQYMTASGEDTLHYPVPVGKTPEPAAKP